MPRVKRKSFEMRRKEIKLKRKEKRDEEMKELQKLRQTDGTEESNTTVDDETEPMSDSQLKESRIAKHAEYVRNYRKNMPEERKRALRKIAAQRMAMKRKTMSEEKKAAIRAADRLRIALKRKNMSEEQKKIAREADRRRVALKRKKWKEESDCFQAAMLRLAIQRQCFLPPSVDLADSSSDDDGPEDIQRFLAVSLITGHSITSN